MNRDCPALLEVLDQPVIQPQMQKSYGGLYTPLLPYTLRSDRPASAGAATHTQKSFGGLRTVTALHS